MMLNKVPILMLSNLVDICVDDTPQLGDLGVWTHHITVHQHPQLFVDFDKLGGTFYSLAKKNNYKYSLEELN